MEIYTTFTRPADIPASVSSNRKMLLFIGTCKPELMNKLSAFGYVGTWVENLFMAREELLKWACEVTHAPFSERVPLSAIFCDIHFPVQEIKSFLNDIQQISIFQEVPFFLMLKKQHSIKEAHHYQFRIQQINDSIYTDSNPFVIDHKIRFYQHFNKIRLQHPGVVMGVEPESLKLKIDNAFKRIFDIAGGFLLLLILSPLFLLIAIAIKLDSPGPVFYVSLRAGKGFRLFKFYKFRTMVRDADLRLSEIEKLNKYQSDQQQSPKFVKVKNDPRVTRVGRLLRKTSLDELPQLFNVIKGDMSLVGNRPLPVYEAVTLTTDLYSTRFIAPAGITGLWQIRKNKKPDMSVEERTNLDVYYARKRNFISDVRILFSTPFAMIQKEEL
ncbi:sugar transferase [Thermoflavifilum thermophilum]|uniref:Sugar transferase involved in LPS biosynthesis (Colanic, teichoic acid) n=1 Tax=Thermoflavifilum thermophilum TaxID=1393122 RepID=A0A1I7NE82_9BACT|nr:sugar transferase [Thermoflavifilum thermophilum]SFV32985.1 Sugar transferase involved in LPS biosynthesis (colanic, teichoic acid) [Thermoflavifilum thermophilum]